MGIRSGFRGVLSSPLCLLPLSHKSLAQGQLRFLGILKTSRLLRFFWRFAAGGSIWGEPKCVPRRSRSAWVKSGPFYAAEPGICPTLRAASVVTAKPGRKVQCDASDNSSQRHTKRRRFIDVFRNKNEQTGRPILRRKPPETAGGWQERIRIIVRSREVSFSSSLRVLARR
jgi:hypothetical protein